MVRAVHGLHGKLVAFSCSNPKQFFRKLAPMKEKTVLTVCTGGVRCEKASGYLKQQGFKDVYQLDGGIVSYMKQYPGQHFLGSLYVFDGRVTMHYDNHYR
jgi:UPF0176 protein